MCVRQRSYEANASCKLVQDLVFSSIHQEISRYTHGCSHRRQVVLCFIFLLYPTTGKELQLPCCCITTPQ
jgi:hypothetical protein